MTELAIFLWRETDIWPLLLFDGLLVYSLVFTILYSVYIAAITLSPSRRVARPRPLTVPILFALSLAVCFTPLKGVLTSYLWGLSATIRLPAANPPTLSGGRAFSECTPTVEMNAP